VSWAEWSAFWSMGGYGLYVWAAYLVALAIVVSEILVLIISRRSILDHLGLRARKRDRGEASDDDRGR